MSGSSRLRRVADAVRAEVSGERALEHVRRISSFHRVQSSTGYNRAAEWVGEQLEREGLKPEWEWVPGDGRTRYHGWLMPEGWECDRAQAFLIEGEARESLCDYATEKLSIVLRSAPARGRFPLVVAPSEEKDGGDPATDVRGKLVLTAGAAHEEYDAWVIARGAAGLVCDGRRLFPPVRDHATATQALNYTSFWWDETTPRGFGLVVSPERGARLRARLRAGASLEVELAIESRFAPMQFPLLSACLPGDQKDEILLLAHLCHPQPSANDNASGVATALECARALAHLRSRGVLDRRGRGVRILWMPEFTGTSAYLARDPARAGRTVAALNLDMVGESQEQTGSTFLIEHPPAYAASFAEDVAERARHASLDWVTSYSGAGHFSMSRLAQVPFGGGSDHALLSDPAVGVPCPMLIQWPDRYYHSSFDTADRCDPGSLALAGRTAATYAAYLSGANAAEAERIASAAARSARISLLRSLDHDDAPRRVEREALRGRAALASMGRLGLPMARVAALAAALDAFVRAEIEPALGPQAPGGSGRRANTRVPHRRLGLLLPYPRHLVPGWGALPREARAAWRRASDATPDAHVICDLAWGAADGRRTVDEIATLVRLETGREERSFIERMFDWTGSLGVSDWRGE